jgi:uncharacterized membrane protein
MNVAEVHLALNHIPVFGMMVTLLLWIWALVRRSDELRRTALLGMVLLALIAVPTYMTGEPAEKRVEHLPGVTEHQIHEHESAAAFALGSSLLLGLLALFGLFRWRGRPIPRAFAIVLLVVNLHGVTVVLRTAYLGGQIRHTEIRPGAVVPPAASGEGEKETEEGH